MDFKKQGVLLVVGAVCMLVGFSKADTPANCTYEEVRGAWTFYMGPGGLYKTVNCNKFDVKQKIHVKLGYPDIATDEFGNLGFWTMIYNQGFEVVLQGRKYFAFSKYTGTEKNSTSYCDQTLNGWSHDVLGHNWACYYAKKDTSLPEKTSFIREGLLEAELRPYVQDGGMIDSINRLQSEWKAGHYEQFDGLTMDHVTRLTGGKKSRVSGAPKAVTADKELKEKVSGLPSQWDWRNINGRNFVPAVRNQGGCGSCYAFSALGMNEARVRVLSNNTLQPSFSPQDIVECSQYSQGCDGGFPYLIGGKYSEDFGLVEETCNPYRGTTGQCKTPPTCLRHYSTHYQYVGGFYGGCSEEAMRLALISHGPVSVSFQVYDDFMSYKGGIYHHTGLTNRFTPFELTNHAVLLVGYGSEKGVNYWTIKNSWGENWGESGYFRIRRGADECAVESIAVQSFPII